MDSILSFPNRGPYGKSNYRGNCTGLLIKALIEHYKLQGLSDYMVGSGTTEDVVREMGIRGTFADLNRGYDMLSMDIPDRAESIFFHPPYNNVIAYSSTQYDPYAVEKATGLSADTIIADDLSRCSSWDEFIKKLNYCCMLQYSALEKDGRMFILVGDIKKQGRLYSMLCDIIKPGTLEQVIIKAQHNCWSERQTYSNNNFVHILHEYLIVLRKDTGLIVPVSWGKHATYDMRRFERISWRDLVCSVMQENGGRMHIQELYDAVKESAKAKANPHWMEKVRQTVQDIRKFVRIERGVYALAPAA